jgi:hypothetical protein
MVNWLSSQNSFLVLLHSHFLLTNISKCLAKLCLVSLNIFLAVELVLLLILCAGYNLQWFDNPIQDGLRNLVGGKEK